MAMDESPDGTGPSRILFINIVPSFPNELAPQWVSIEKPIIHAELHFIHCRGNFESID